MIERVREFAAANDLPWPERAGERLEEYLGLLMKFNDSMNLIGPLSESQVVDELFVDSLVPAALSAPRGPILDVGTGAGFPGIPLQILYPEIPATLVEPRRKRSTFLKIVRTRLALESLTLERCRLEELDEEQFQYVISKAFRPPAEWLRSAARFRADDGVIVCMTTPAERDAALEAAEGLGLEECARLDEVASLEGVGASDERAVYVFGRESG